MTSEHDDLDLQIKKIMNRIISDIRLGDSVEEALGRAIELSDNTFFKMTLTILKINHNVGTDKTITALNNIPRSMLSIIDNVQLLRDKINSVIGAKAIFILILLAAPVIHSLWTDEITGTFYSDSMSQILMCGIMAFGFFGQWVLDRQAGNAVKEV